LSFVSFTVVTTCCDFDLNPLTFKLANTSRVLRSNVVRNLSEIEQSATELLTTYRISIIKFSMEQWGKSPNSSQGCMKQTLQTWRRHRAIIGTQKFLPDFRHLALFKKAKCLTGEWFQKV